jgi:hypothetical protein
MPLNLIPMALALDAFSSACSLGRQQTSCGVNEEPFLVNESLDCVIAVLLQHCMALKLN